MIVTSSQKSVASDWKDKASAAEARIAVLESDKAAAEKQAEELRLKVNDLAGQLATQRDEEVRTSLRQVSSGR